MHASSLTKYLINIFYLHNCILSDVLCPWALHSFLAASRKQALLQQPRDMRTCIDVSSSSLFFTRTDAAEPEADRYHQGTCSKQEALCACARR